MTEGQGGSHGQKLSGFTLRLFDPPQVDPNELRGQDILRSLRAESASNLSAWGSFQSAQPCMPDRRAPLRPSSAGRRNVPKLPGPRDSFERSERVPPRPQSARETLQRLRVDTSRSVEKRNYFVPSARQQAAAMAAEMRQRQEEERLRVERGASQRLAAERFARFAAERNERVRCDLLAQALEPRPLPRQSQQAQREVSAPAAPSFRPQPRTGLREVKEEFRDEAKEEAKRQKLEAVWEHALHVRKSSACGQQSRCGAGTLLGSRIPSGGGSAAEAQALKGRRPMSAPMGSRRVRA
ncbi:unnamed protein product [Polarella glacialis]|uniref:Uncharacterized protein n=1 Tax=Polarella glacialis TaxID=89957 RepID=A0A813F530_POLGL|nr:unnamed protein product [Polarella glacialis]